MFSKVFISHAKEDYEVAENIYNFLKQNHFEPWLDKKELLPGMNWDKKIKQALKESQFIIVLLSSISVNKRGYIQREFKLALEYAETMLDDDIYIVPIKLDDCKVPDKLSTYQWTEINDGFDIILKALNFQRDKRISETSIKERQINDFSIQTIDLNLPNISSEMYNCEIPKFYKNQYFDAEHLNTILKGFCYEIIGAHRQEFIEEKEFLDNFDVDINFTLNYISKNIISISLIDTSMIGRKPHPNTTIQCYNIKLDTMYTLTLYDVLDLNESILSHLIQKYGDDEQQDLINALHLNNSNSWYETYDEIQFYIKDDVFGFDFSNILPRAYLAIAYLEVPLKEITLKISL